MRGRSIQTSLIRPRGEASPSNTPEAAPPKIDCPALLLGVDVASADAISSTLRSLGASAHSAPSADEALAQLEDGAFGFVVLGDAVRTEADDIARRVRLNPRLARLPILLLAPPGADDRAPPPLSADGMSTLGAAASPAVMLAPRPPAAVLASQLTLLVELHRERTAAFDIEDQLGQARLDLRDAADANAALAEQARHAMSELATAQTQLVQAAKLAALGELVAGVAHELNNPLSFATSHLATLRRCVSRGLDRLCEFEPETRAEADRVEERLDGVMLGLDRIKSLVVKLQTFSRLDDGNTKAANVAEAVSTLLTILEHRIGDRIRVSTVFEAPATIYCQSSLFNQCVMNLLVNAIDAVEPRQAEGSIQISGRAEGEFYVLRVVDNGQGVARDIQGRIFEPFFTTKPEGKGTGLGLSIATSVVKKHDGTLELSPAAAGGTQAIIRLPLGRVTAHPPAAAQAR